MGAVPRADRIWKTSGRILRKGPSSQNVQATKAPGKPIPGQPGFLQEPGLLPVGCDIHTEFSPAVQGSHGQDSEGQWCDSSITHGTCSPLLQASLGTGGSWVTHGTSARCGTWHDATTLWRDRGWEETLGWVVSGWKCSSIGAEGVPNGGKTGMREASRTGTLYTSRGTFRDAWLWVLYPSAHTSSPMGLGGAHTHASDPASILRDAASLPEPISSPSLHPGMRCLSGGCK